MFDQPLHQSSPVGLVAGAADDMGGCSFSARRDVCSAEASGESLVIVVHSVVAGGQVRDSWFLAAGSFRFAENALNRLRSCSRWKGF